MCTQQAPSLKPRRPTSFPSPPTLPAATTTAHLGVSSAQPAWEDGNTYQAPRTPRKTHTQAPLRSWKKALATTCSSWMNIKQFIKLRKHNDLTATGSHLGSVCPTVQGCAPAASRQSSPRVGTTRRESVLSLLIKVTQTMSPERKDAQKRGTEHASRVWLVLPRGDCTEHMSVFYQPPARSCYQK